MEKILSMAHTILKNHLNNSSIAIDATCGKGNDTLFLAKICKKVYAFDIQIDAINMTKERCKEYQNIEFLLKSHEYISDIGEKVDGIIFNLGYLPTKSHTLTTLLPSTIAGVTKGIKMLNKGGVCVVVAYPGCPSGREENEGLMELLPSIDQHEFEVVKYEFINQVNDPPILYIIERISL